MARKAPEPEEVAGFAMTPMIDIVFQLIVFFMLVLDLSAKKIEKLTLPVADQAFKDAQSDPDEVILNVLANGDIKINGKFYHDHANKPDDNANLENFFKNRRATQKYWLIEGGRVVKYPILIRADRASDWIHTQKIMMIASKDGGVYRVELGAKMSVGAP